MKFNKDVTEIAIQIVYGLIALICLSILAFGLISLLSFNETLFTTALVYYCGFVLAYAIAYHNIKKFKTNDSPWFAAAFSWITVLLFIGACLYRLFKHDPNN